MRMRLALTAVVAVVLLAGCGDTVGVDDIAPDPAGAPYDGPMHVKRGYSDEATVLEAAGAAGLALECDGEPRRGGGGDYVDGGLEKVQDSPQAAFDDLLDQERIEVPEDGYRVERVDDGRVLLSYDVDDRTRVAAVVHEGMTDYDDGTGWGVEAWASCDPAELGIDVAEDLGFQIWTDAAGRPVPTSDVLSFSGSEHCDWQDLTWLDLGMSADNDRDFDRYLSDDDEGQLLDFLSTASDDSAALPADATDTGWQRDGRELWLGQHPRAAYLVSVDDPADVQLWPLVTEQIGCA
jgi:hypothetical protein